MPLTIRWRLTLWNALAVGVVLVFFAGLTYWMLRSALYDQTDRLLLATIALLRDDPHINRNTEKRIRHWVEEFKDHQGLYCIIRTSDGKLFEQTVGLRADEGRAISAAGKEARFENVQLGKLGPQRMLAERVTLVGVDYDVFLFAPLESIEAELGQVRTVLLMAGPLALLLAGSFAYLLARKALAPMDQIRRNTDAITAERLDHRLAALNPDDELGRLAGTINSMIARLERSFSEVRRFTADASHELRTPLTALRTEVEVALNKELTPADAKELLSNVLEELVRMSRLTDQLLTLCRRDAGVEPFAPAAVDVGALAGGVVDALQPLADARRITFRLEAKKPVQISADETRLRQVLINLLDNALKYTPEGGSVMVRIEAQEKLCVITVVDTGIGIDAEHLPRVFERFYRVDKARSRAEGGTGLGLSIAQSVVVAHGGSINVASSPGRGSTFTVRLPILRQA